MGACRVRGEAPQYVMPITFAEPGAYRNRIINGNTRDITRQQGPGRDYRRLLPTG